MKSEIRENNQPEVEYIKAKRAKAKAKVDLMVIVQSTVRES